MRIHIRRRSTTFRSGVQRTTITEGGCLTIQHCACNLHFVVEKGIERDLWGCLRVRLWPCDIQDERVAVFKVSYLLYYIKIQGKTRNYTKSNPDSLVKVIKWTNILRVSWFNLMLCPVETGCWWWTGLDRTVTLLTLNWKETGLISLKHSSPS